MKIAYLVNVYPKTSHSFIRREIRALESLGFEVERISVRHPADDLVDERDRAEASRTRVILEGGVFGLLSAGIATLVMNPSGFYRALRLALSLGRKSDRGVFRNLAYFLEACVVARRAPRDGIEHIHAHFGTNPPAVCMLIHALGGPPFSFAVHGPEEFDRPIALKLDRKIAAARFVVAISEFGRSQLFRWSAHGDWKKIHVVHCGVDELFLEAEPTPVPDAPRLVCVGRLCEQKGQLSLVEAAGRLAKGGVDFELVLAGDGEMRAEIEAACREHDLAKRVRITGWIGNDQVRDEILAARAMVLPSFAEGLPVVIMEALALHRPVVSTYVAGIPELVVPTECGWLVPAGDVDALVAAMQAALEAPQARLEDMGRAGAARVRARHDVRTEAAKLAAHLHAAHHQGHQGD